MTELVPIPISEVPWAARKLVEVITGYKPRFAARVVDQSVDDHEMVEVEDEH